MALPKVLEDGVLGWPNGVEVAMGSFEAGVEALGVEEDSNWVDSLLKMRPG